MTASVFEVGGHGLTLPVRVRDGDQWSAQYLVPAGAAQALVRHAGLEVVQLLPRWAMAMVTFARYRDTDLGPYDEFVLSFLARCPGAEAGPGRHLPRRRRRGRTGIYPYRLAATEALAVEAGQAIWGYPRSLAEIAINAKDGRAECVLAQDGALVLRIAVREGGPLRLTDPNLPNLSRRDGVHLISPWEQQGPARARFGGARLELGSHPVADGLRSLGLPKRALMSATMRGLRASYGAPVVASTADAPLPAAREGSGAGRRAAGPSRRSSGA